EDGCGDVGEDAGSVGPLLYLDVEARPIDRHPDPDREILRERELVRTVRWPGRSSRKRQRAERSPSTPDWHTDDRHGLARQFGLHQFAIEILAVPKRRDHQ